MNKTCVNASLENYGTIESLKEILKAKNRLNSVDAKKVVGNDLCIHLRRKGLTACSFPVCSRMSNRKRCNGKWFLRERRYWTIQLRHPRTREAMQNTVLPSSLL